MHDIASLTARITYPLSDTEKSKLEKAFAFAQVKHAGQKRNSGEDYFVHVLEVAKNCASLGMDITTIVSALLHDTLEDTDTTEEELLGLFGEQVVFLVKGVTKLGKIKYRGRERHVESMRKLFVATAEDLRVLIIKLADRLHNVSTLEHVRPDKRTRIALETIEVHAALAGRLGMGKLKGMLEDYAFPHAFPKDYARTKTFFIERSPKAQETARKAHTELTETISGFNLSNIEIDSRVKHLYSLYRKMLKYEKRKESSDQIYDIVALRVLTDSVTDCYQVLGLVHMLWKPLPGRIKDYIALPKPNGYQSLHTTVITPTGIVEIQIRTHAMHQESEMGIAAHFAYKETSHTPAPLQKKKLRWIDDLKEFHSAIKNPNKFLDQLRTDLFKNRIFVFTPQGDVIDLPEHASPVDFAYAVHSDIGSTLSSARVNGKMAALGTSLNNGDIVEIITNKNAKPSSKWLDYAKTGMAKRRIRSYIAEHGGLLEKFLAKE